MSVNITNETRQGIMSFVSQIGSSGERIQGDWYQNVYAYAIDGVPAAPLPLQVNEDTEEIVGADVNRVLIEEAQRQGKNVVIYLYEPGGIEAYKEDVREFYRRLAEEGDQRRLNPMMGNENEFFDVKDLMPGFVRNHPQAAPPLQPPAVSVPFEPVADEPAQEAPQAASHQGHNKPGKHR